MLQTRFLLSIALLLFCGIVLQSVSPAMAQPAAMTWNATSKVAIILPQNATLPEKTAADELKSYLTQITGGTITIQNESGAGSTPPAIYVGNTQFARRAGVDGSTLTAEEWRIKTRDGNLILAGGGTRGTLYATYHFLEDNAGVRWWSPWEETVPKPGVLAVPTLDKRGKPAFAYRDIYMLYGRDNGRFMARRRLNREGDAPVGAEYGGSRNYGPPYHVHTLYKILSPAKYFDEHPDWFIGQGEQRPTAHNSQLAMSNPAMRQEFLKLLREIIRQSHADAKAKGLPAPDVFSVSQEDNAVGFATPADAELLAKNDGADSAILLDFVNFLADGIKDEFPDVYIDTLAYYSGEKAPKTIRPRDNVIIRLTDTKSNLILPITAPRNHVFHDNLIAWSKIAKNLRVWDYAINFTYTGLPTPTTQTYVPDIQFWKAHNVEGIFVEHEYPVRADLRDFKIWLQTKLFENPDLDYNALVREFTDGFYGPAGASVRRYIFALRDEARKVGEEKGYEDLKWFTPPRLYNYLSADFVVRADAMFADAERAVVGDKVLLRRVRHARMPLDRYIARLYDELKEQWTKAGHSADTMPFKRDEVIARYAKTWEEQIELRLSDPRQVAAEREVLATEVKKLDGTLYTRRATPDENGKFDPARLKKAVVFGPETTRNYGSQAKLVTDKDTATGKATRLLLDDVPQDKRDKYELPMPWGIYDKSTSKGLLSNAITAQQIPGPGYHWYKLGEIELPKNTYVYFFWSWVIQVDLKTDASPDQIYEVWAQLKFEGPTFPHGKAGEKDAISFARAALIPRPAQP